MRYIHILSLLACAQAAIANPVYTQVKAKGVSNASSQSSQSSKSSQSSSQSAQDTSSSPTSNNDVTKDSVQRAADNFAQDAGIVSNALNAMTSMTDQAAIKATAQRAFDAESDEDNQRKILAAAAGSAGDSANGKIQKFTPTVLDGLDAITKDASPDSVQKNTKTMEDARNPNILPSITELSNAALDAMGLDKTAPELKLTTGSSGNSASSSSTNSDDRASGSSSSKGASANDRATKKARLNNRAAKAANGNRNATRSARN